MVVVAQIIDTLVKPLASLLLLASGGGLWVVQAAVSLKLCCWMGSGNGLGMDCIVPPLTAWKSHGFSAGVEACRCLPDAGSRHSGDLNHSFLSYSPAECNAAWPVLVLCRPHQDSAFHLLFQNIRRILLETVAHGQAQ